MYTVVVDSKGRIVIPKELRKKLNIKAGTKLVIDVFGEKIVIARAKSVAEKYAGKYRAKIPIPEDLDEFVNMVIKSWWSENM